jgi:hypothetical protein
MEHSIKAGHRSDFNISILIKAIGSTDCIMKEATEIQLHSSKFNRDRRFTLNQVPYVMTNMLKQSNETPMKKPGQTQQALDSTQP